MARLCFIVMAGFLGIVINGIGAAATPPPYFWHLSSPSLSVGNSAELSLEICDRRQFQWFPMVLPHHPSVLSRTKGEIAIDKGIKGEPCEGTRWTWTILPTLAGSFQIPSMPIRYSRFGSEVEIDLPGPRLRVQAKPQWLPTLIAYERPRVFEWLASESPQKTDALVRHTFVIQSSLSRTDLEQWLGLMLEAQPPWNEIPALVKPLEQSLGDAFTVTVYAPLQSPTIAALNLRLGFYNAATNTIAFSEITQPAVVSDVPRPARDIRLIERWMQVYTFGQRNTIWIAAGVMLLLAGMHLLRKQGWRLQRSVILWRLRRAQTANEVWKVLKHSNWPAKRSPTHTPDQWLAAASTQIDEASVSRLRAAIDGLKRALFGSSAPAPLDSLRSTLSMIKKRPSL